MHWLLMAHYQETVTAKLVNSPATKQPLVPQLVALVLIGSNPFLPPGPGDSLNFPCLNIEKQFML